MKKFSYTNVLKSKPTFEVKEGAREVIVETVSCMCDNMSKLTFKKNSEGDFKMNGNGQALSNWQMKYAKDEIEWKADEGNWNEVFEMINTGTRLVCEVRSR